MKLNLTKRTGTKKSEAKRIRRSGDIPAVLYGKGHENQLATVKGTEFLQFLRTLPQGRLATSQFELSLEGTSFKAIVKNIAYHPTTYRIEHLDFLLLTEKTPVAVNVPIEVVGLADCPGIKLGGVLHQVTRALPVSCLPRDIPSFFRVDVRELNVEESKLLSDLPLPEGVRPLMRMNEVAVVIAKPKKA